MSLKAVADDGGTNISNRLKGRFKGSHIGVKRFKRKAGAGIDKEGQFPDQLLPGAPFFEAGELIGTH